MSVCVSAGEVYKFGISSGKINAAGQSYRAVRQVSKLNAAGGRYVPVLLVKNLANRSKALQWEEPTVGMFRKSLGHELDGNKRHIGISYLEALL